MAISVFNGAGYGNTKLYLGNVIWNRNSVYGSGQYITLNAPKGSIGLRCTCSTNTYDTYFGDPSSGTVLFKESISRESKGEGSVTIIFTEPLKIDDLVGFYYGSGSGCNYNVYPIMVE